MFTLQNQIWGRVNKPSTYFMLPVNRAARISSYCKRGFFCSVNHFSEGGVNANHNVMCSPSLTENDSSLLKNSVGNFDGEWNFLSKEAGRGCFILASDKNKKDQKNLRGKLN